MPLHFVVLVVRRHRALVVLVRGRITGGVLLQRARRVLVVVLMRAVLQLILVIMGVRLHLWRVRRHHGVVPNAQRRRAAFAILVGVARREHLAIVPVEHRRVRIRSGLSVESRVTAATRREQVVGR